MSALVIQPVISAVIDQVTISSYGNIKVSTVPWLHTDGQFIKNEDNETVYLRGAAMSGLEASTYPRPAYWHGANFDSLISSTAEVGKKPNIIRIVCALWEYWPWTTGNTLEHDAALMHDAMDYAVNFAVENEIYISLDFHGVKDEHYPLIGEDPTLWIEWMKHWAIRYRNIPNVVYELWNEPYIKAIGGGDLELGQQRWINMIERCCAEINEVHPKALFIVNVDEVPVQEYFIENPLPYNAVYAFGFYYFHYDYTWYREPYANEDWDLAYERFLGLMLNRFKIDCGLPMLCREFGWGNNAHDIEVEEPNFGENMHDVFQIWTDYDVHWYEFIWGQRSYGLADSSWNLRDPTGLIWAEYLNPTS